MGTTGETKFVESSTESLLSSRSLCQAVTQAVTVLREDRLPGRTSAAAPELIRSGPRGGLQGPQTDSIPLKREGLWQQSCRTSRHDLSLSEQLQPKALPDWSREGTEILPCLNIRSGECPELSSLQDQTWALAQPHARQAGFVWFVSFLHPSLIRFARFVFWAARALCEKPRWITRWNVTAFGILNCFILVTRFALRRNKADVVETQLVGAPSWRAYDRYLHVLIYYWEKMKISKHSYRQW